MPRYLTPPKICLLVLVDLYIADQIPSSVKLNLLSFVATQINIQSDHDSSSIEEKFRLTPLDLTTLSKTLSQWQSNIPGRSVYDILLKRIWELEELDSLHSLFQQFGELVAPSVVDSEDGTAPKVSRSSPMGQFIRRSCVEFTRLHFSDSKALWDSFASYRAPSCESWGFEKSRPCATTRR